jgi:hypothetical protein
MKKKGQGEGKAGLVMGWPFFLLWVQATTMKAYDAQHEASESHPVCHTSLGY